MRTWAMRGPRMRVGCVSSQLRFADGSRGWCASAAWLGVVLIGITLGARLRAQKFRCLDPIETVAPSWLPWLGRHSLVVYMAHQPILIGMLWLIVRY